MAEFNDLEFMKNDRLWSGGCCIKQRPKPGEKAGIMGYRAYGVIVNNHEPVIIYMRGKTHADDFARTTTYPTFQAVVDDGWVVD